MQKLKNKDIRVTPQRLGVCEILSREKIHLTAEQIYGRIKNKFPAISLATVYTILQLYVQKGLASEIRITFDKSSFEARTDSHHHFLCKRCQKIYDIELHPCPALKREEVDGHAIEQLQGYFYGLCRECRKEENSHERD